MNQTFLERIIHQFSIDVYGIHGSEHWIRVYENGYRLAQLTGADVNVMMWFALLHDCRRVSNSEDQGHGQRAAEYARKHKREIDLDENQFSLLVQALSCHTRGCDYRADITVQTCLDADRLDIVRTGCIVDPAQLFTEAAKDEAIKNLRRSRRYRFSDTIK
jgi:uncharacterized protein